MKCNYCDAEIPNEAKVCPYCDAAVLAEPPTRVAEEKTFPAEMEQKPMEQETTSATPLLGKKYTFISTRGTNLMGIFNSKI